MVFSSLLFLYLFLPLSLLCYFACRGMEGKNWILLLFSLFFYSWGEPVYVLLLIFSAGVNYGSGRLMGRCAGSRGKKTVMILTVLVDLGILAVFKYAGFAVESVNHLLGTSLPVPSITMPIGISFYTFQALSYAVDVYRGQVKVQKSFRDFLLYVALFPQLIAGPIVRYSEIEPQLHSRTSSWEGIFYGMTRFCIGLGKKVLLANYCGKAASRLLDGELAAMTTAGAWFGILMFAFEIYFDFSGYSDMAIGLGRVFGFRYSENFDLPYMSRSISEFWRRWHISLGSFFRDYVYIPLGGNRRHQVLNLFVVWALTGLWHGASWNFVLWGLYFFLLIVLEKKLRAPLEKIPGVFRWLLTALCLLVGWTLFYYTDLGRLCQVLGVMAGQKGAGFANSQLKLVVLNSLPLLMACAVVSTPLLRLLWLGVNSLDMKKQIPFGRQAAYGVLVFLFDAAILFAATVSLVGSGYNPFLYFRF